MKQSEFIKILKEKEIKFEQKDGRIIINGGGVNLPSLTELPENVEFNNAGGVNLYSLTKLPENVQFNNGGFVNLSSLTELPENVEFNNGGYVYLDSLTELPENVQFNNGGDVWLKEGKQELKPYIDRCKVEKEGDYVYLYKKVSKDFKTQENTENETLWKIGSTLEHPDWNPTQSECGPGKFHACAKPHWCNYFRNEKGDKYIQIKIHVNDIYEWKNNPTFPQKISFKKATVIKEIIL